MFGLTGRLTRTRRRLIAAAVVVAMAIALVLAHSAFSSHHQSVASHHGGAASVVFVFCLAVLEAGLAVAVVQLVRRDRERPTNWALPAPPAMLVPVLAGPDPPRPLASQLQVFLR